ncbi:hypothetical protein [Tenacibaculum sp. 190524A05c]|uniref:Natural product n=1 Tax=Tenacibaculum platacis TaxID=3137852 RepID=A0ABM9P3J2_9FLAO
MKQSILKIGTVLNKTEQKLISGGLRSVGISDGDCNQAVQSQIHCSPTSDSCELDAVCNYYTGRCECDDPTFGGLG